MNDIANVKIKIEAEFEEGEHISFEYERFIKYERFIRGWGRKINITNDLLEDMNNKGVEEFINEKILKVLNHFIENGKENFIRYVVHKIREKNERKSINDIANKN